MNGAVNIVHAAFIFLLCSLFRDIADAQALFLGVVYRVGSAAVFVFAIGDAVGGIID
jgi:hypothetical protein